MVFSDIIFISQLHLFTQSQTLSLCVGLFIEKYYSLSQNLLLSFTNLGVFLNSGFGQCCLFWCKFG
jgi:hypothetical protein